MLIDKVARKANELLMNPPWSTTTLACTKRIW
jgi:hypothetical protein